MQKDLTKMLLVNLLSQMAMQARRGLNPKIRINRNEVTFSAQEMASEKMDLTDKQIQFLKEEAHRMGLKI